MKRIRSIQDRKGSSTVMLAMVFVAFAVSIAAAIGISRELAVKSECESFGRAWTKAILSEYDEHLLEDYGIMAYFGNEAEVIRRIDSYMDYSAAGKLRIRLGGSESDLAGYELGELENFRHALRTGFASYAADALIGEKRSLRIAAEQSGPGEEQNAPADSSTERAIGNKVVIDTLPSGSISNSISNDRIIEKSKSLDSSEGIMKAAADYGIEALFIYKYFGTAVTVPASELEKEAYLRNEWEYIIKGSLSDKDNAAACRRRLFLIRNALNLAALYKDPAKVELITSAAELITPGPLGAATQVILAEAWAALETEEDIKALLDGERIPVMKKESEWKCGLQSVISSGSVRKKLDEGSRELLDENSEELRHLAGSSNGNVVRDGLSYDDYLMIMILTMNRDVRLLRIMDLVQINMKFRYYRDFNMMEYFTGVRFSLTANGRDYVFEDHYR